MKKIFEFFVFHAAAFVLAWLFYIVILQIGIFDFIKVYFYKTIVILIITGMILLITELILKHYWKKATFDYKDIILSFVVFMSINMVWLSTIVVSLDRSLSVFVLSYLAEENRSYSEEELNEVFQTIFIEKYEMLDRRFWEQLESGNIEEEGGGYKLTDRGEGLVDIFKAVGKIYKVDDRFINPNQ
ncbi:hypothetical protein C8E03_10540 [Lachnotalea glycerini]|jgi:hypothetical protein|uniref:Uncharacterized protein n=1 Tax=Lachnotalea glycerini TaxID=1763509 RepID=A0A255IKR6_9FIRM|nr:hypothetical protein [Lachnotalea glycerini]PXV90133.1 hypothetical protein C8E03_10540 [Lachnotalea glycerini]RDY29547.1 hypothetical protein CG710_018155 [Lachnotalea glycerini]